MLDYRDYEKDQRERRFVKSDSDPEKNFNGQEVVISKINIPFPNLVSFLVKLSIAAIPAAIIFAIIVAIFWSAIAAFLIELFRSVPK